MLVLFFTIIFIAELIITSWVISQLIKADKAVCEANIKVTKYRPYIKNKLQIIKTANNIIYSSIDYFNLYVEDKKSKIQSIINKDLLTTLIVTFSKVPYKKIWTIINIITSINKLFSNKKRGR